MTKEEGIQGLSPGVLNPVTAQNAIRAHQADQNRARPRARHVALGWRSIRVLRPVRIAPRDRGVGDADIRAAERAYPGDMWMKGCPRTSPIKITFRPFRATLLFGP